MSIWELFGYYYFEIFLEYYYCVYRMNPDEPTQHQWLYKFIISTKIIRKILISILFYIQFQTPLKDENNGKSLQNNNNKTIKNSKHHKNNNVNSDDKDIKNPYLYSQLKNVFNEHHQYIQRDRQLRKNVNTKCKHAVYKFMKGLLKRKLKNSDEDLYVEVIMLI